MNKVNFLIAVFFISAMAIAQVGVGNNNPVTTLDVSGAISNRQGTAINVPTTNQIPSDVSFVRVTGEINSGSNVNLAEPTVRGDGQRLIIANTTSYTTAEPGDVFFENTGIPNGSALEFIYDNVNSEWYTTEGGNFTINSQPPSAGNYWSLSGNTGTSIATDYLGTSDAKDLIIKTNSTERMRVESTGDVGIGTDDPTDKLEVKSSGSNFIKSNSGSNSNAAGFIFAQADTNKWVIEAGGTFNTGNLAVYDIVNDKYPFLIEAGTGDVGIGIPNPSVKFEVEEDKAPFWGTGAIIKNSAGGQLSIIPGFDGDVAGVDKVLLDVSGVGTLVIGDHLEPIGDNFYTNGTSARRWSAVYSGNGTIQTSDIRLKKNITPLSYGLQDIMKIETISYDWKDDSNKLRKIGFNAQQLQTIVPELVNVGDDVNQTLGINYGDITPILTKAIQEQQAQLEAKDAEIKELKAEIEAIKAHLNIK